MNDCEAEGKSLLSFCVKVADACQLMGQVSSLKTLSALALSLEQTGADGCQLMVRFSRMKTLSAPAMKF